MQHGYLSVMGESRQIIFSTECSSSSSAEIAALNRYTAASSLLYCLLFAKLLSQQQVDQSA
jgi:hypothetical protein